MTYFPGGKKKLGSEIADTIYNISIDIEKKTNFIIKNQFYT